MANPLAAPYQRPTAGPAWPLIFAAPARLDGGAAVIPHLSFTAIEILFLTQSEAE
jgi:hypothetical protein